MRTIRVEMTEVELEQFREFQRKEKSNRQVRSNSPPDIPQENRVYLWRMCQDSIMTSGNNSNAVIIKGKKEAEYIARQLEIRYNQKFYLEEFIPPKDFDYKKYKKNNL